MYKSGYIDWTVWTTDKTEDLLMTLAVTSHMVLLPGIVLFGFIGNIVSFLVFTTTKLKKMSSSVCLSVLAVLDFRFLVCVLMFWIDTLNFRVFHRPVMCQLLVYLTFLFSFMSVWIVNLMTLEMYIVTFYFSTRTLQLLNRNLSKRVIFCLTVFAVLLYAHNLWTVRVTDTKDGKSICTESNTYFVTIMSFVDSLMTSLVPMVMMIIMTSRLLLATTRDATKEFHMQLETLKEENIMKVKTSARIEQDDKSLNPGESRHTKELSKSLQPREVRTNLKTKEITSTSKNQTLRAYKKIRKLLIAIFVVFLFLNLPQHIYKLQSQLRSLMVAGYVKSQKEKAVTHLLDLLFYLSFSINFLVYSGLTRQFRNHIFAIPIYSRCG